jgi:hypothetical protein
MRRQLEIGDVVRLTTPYKGWNVGEITRFFGRDIEVRLTNGKEVLVYEDDLEEEV